MSIFAFHRHPIVAVEIERAAQEIEMRLVSARGTVIAAVLGYLPISDEFAFRLNQGLPKPAHIHITRGSGCCGNRFDKRSEEYTSELQSLMRISYAVFCLKKKNHTTT